MKKNKTMVKGVVEISVGAALLDPAIGAIKEAEPGAMGSLGGTALSGGFALGVAKKMKLGDVK